MSVLGQVQFRRDLAANWTAINPILLDGEPAIETDTDLFKIGDGVTPWNMLPYGGLAGDDGWSPVIATVPDGERRVLRLIDWVGGEGTKPPVPTNNYIGPTGLTNLAGATDIRGGIGATGNKGWSPVFAVVADVERRVLQVTDWVGGEGAKPATGSFVGTTGFVSTAAQAVDIRGGVGAQGNDGWEPVLANVADGERRVLRLVDWIGGTGTKPNVPTNNYIGSTGFTNLAGATDVRGATGQTGPAAFTTLTAPFEQRGDTGITSISVVNSDGFAVLQSIFIENSGYYTVDAIPSSTTLDIVLASENFALPETIIPAGSRVTAAGEQGEPGPPGPPGLDAPAGPQFVSSVLAATQANTTVTPADLTGQVFTLPPGKTIRIQGNLIFTAAAATTGAFYGFRVAHGAGANGNVQGSWNAEVALTSALAATGLADGDAVNLEGGQTTANGVLGTASVAGNNSAWIMLTLTNRSTNANATVALQFRSEVAGSAVTAQIGTSADAIIG